VTGATASALLEVNGEGNIYINVGKERKPGKDTREGEGNEEGNYRSSGTLEPIVTGPV